MSKYTLLALQLFSCLSLSGCGGGAVGGGVGGGVGAEPNSATSASVCAGRVVVNLTVVLSGEISEGKKDLLIELRQGVVGHSTVVGAEHFHGSTGTVAFNGVCAGSYFMDIGNGKTVAVTPVHSFSGFGTSEHNITVSFTTGNVSNMPKKDL